MNNRYNTAPSEGLKSARQILQNIPEVQVTELTGKEAAIEWDAWADTIPGHWDLVPMEKDQFSQKLERAGVSSRQNDPTLKGVK